MILSERRTAGNDRRNQRAKKRSGAMTKAIIGGIADIRWNSAETPAEGPVERGKIGEARFGGNSHNLTVALRYSW
jgi:hypothetical protein